jgi:hypothetical protein
MNTPFGNLDDESVKAIQGSAYERLINILSSKKIIATPMPWTNRKAVAFTECPWWSLLAHANDYSPYGIGFTKPHLFAAGGGPAIYLRPDLHEKQQEFIHNSNPNLKGFHSDLYAFVTPFLPDYAPPNTKDKYKDKFDKPIDYSHEREWRVPHDFVFELNDVKFVIVDSYEDLENFPKEEAIAQLPQKTIHTRACL